MILQKLTHSSFSSFPQALSSLFSFSSSSSRPSGRSLFCTWCGSSWTGTHPSKVSAAGPVPRKQRQWQGAVQGFLPCISLPQGGRRFEWIRNSAMWKHVRDYYPVKVLGHPLSSSSLSQSPTLTHPCLCTLGSLTSDGVGSAVWRCTVGSLCCPPHSRTLNSAVGQGGGQLFSAGVPPPYLFPCILPHHHPRSEAGENRRVAPRPQLCAECPPTRDHVHGSLLQFLHRRQRLLQEVPRDSDLSDRAGHPLPPSRLSGLPHVLW